MRRLFPMLALALAPLAAPMTASAHGPDIRIAGLQFAYTNHLDSGGLAGYLSVPLQPPVYVGGSASTDGGARASVVDQLGAIQNHDRLPHTFSHCTSACATANGVSGPGALFDISLPGGAVVDFLTAEDPLPEGTYTFMCRVHPYMRGELKID